MIIRRPITALLAAACALTATSAPGQEGAPKAKYAGPVEGGYLLPNGWTVTPAGKQVPLHDLPLNIIPLADGKRALVSTNGYNEHQLSLVDLEQAKAVAQVAEKQSWFGLVHRESDGLILWPGGGADVLHRFALKGDAIEPGEPWLGRPAPEAGEKGGKHFRGGLAISRDGKVLYSLDVDAGAISAVDLADPSKVITASIGGRPYDVAQSRNGAHLYVSDWAGGIVRVLDPGSLRTVAKIDVGEHPNQIAAHPNDDRLFVACANSNSVAVIDSIRGVVTETIYTPLFPKSPEGSTPDALAVAPDGKSLFVANADNNCIAVVDIAEPGESAVKGFIPTGWYPTAVAVTPDGKSLLVGVGKGNQTRANPLHKEGEEPKDAGPRRRPFPYIGTTLSGALSIIPIPGEEQLEQYTNRVYKNCPYSDKLLTAAPSERKTAIPNKVGDPSPIKHVIYIIKENRTYDQVFGDMKRGNGDPSLVMFGEEVTPNHHNLADEFVLLDNLYCNGQVSRDGHPWSTMAYNTDYIARDWMLTYSGREGIDDDDEDNLQKAPSGYLWDAAARKGLSYRNYGEYGHRVSQPDGTVSMEGRTPSLIGHICPNYGIPKAPGVRVRDTDNVDVFLEEFAEFEAKDSLPSLIVMSLGEDHTSGTRPGAYTPQACVASNDLALGRLVEAVSESKYWPETAIFVIEDDAQNGPDHVDAHRTVGLVISPYTRRGHLDSTQYTTVSMLRTMELILGLPPLSQYDAGANPMFESFTDKPDLKPYKVAPPKIDLNAVNAATAYGADRSMKMDFSEYDRINDFELNEILWRAIKGADAPLPPAVRRAIALRPGVPVAERPGR